MPLAPDVPYEIGEAAFGGYVAGLIDTTRGNIITADASQTGQRYVLIVAPKSLEQSGLAWKTAQSAGPAASRTRWNGLAATQAMNSSTYPAAQYCAGLSYPSDAGSPWYLPAMDELEVIYRNLKATTENNYTGNRAGGDFPGGTVNYGENPSSDPVGAPYTTTTPARTNVAAFRDGGGQDLGNSGTSVYYWTSTDYDASLAWLHYASGSFAGYQSNANKTVTAPLVRPVRRVLVSDLNTAPNAPILVAPADASTIDRGIPQAFTWNHSDPDGDAQAGYKLQYRPVGGAWTLVSGTTSQSHTFPGGTFAAGDHEWQVCTSDGTAYGAWSATSTFTAATPPSDPTITDPIGGQRIDAPNYTAAYEVSGTYTDSEWRTVADNAGSPDGSTVYWISGPTGTATSTVVPFATDGRYEHLQVRVYNAGWWSQWASVRVFVSHLKQGSATGGFTFSNSAAGDTPPNAGSVTSGYVFTAAAAGNTPPNTGSATSGVSWSVSASGTNGQGGSAVTAYSFTTSATGERAPLGHASGEFAFTPSAAGSGKPTGWAVTSYRYTSSATGDAIRLMFTPPVGKVRASMGAPKPFRFYGVTVSSSVIFRNGHFQEVRSPEADEVDGLMEGVSWFPGGRTYEVDNDTKLLLEADGFTVDSV